MRSSKLNYFVVGVFVIAMVAGLVVAIGMLTGRTGATDAYYAVYRNVTGVKFGTQVVYEGYPIGQVEAVTPQENDGRMEFRVDFEVTQGWRLPKDSEVEIAAPSLLSAVALTIHAGDSKDSLKPGGRVQERTSSDVMVAVSSLAGQVAELIDSEAKPLMRNVNNAVGEINDVVVEVNRFLSSDANLLVQDVKRLVRDVTDRIPGIAQNIENFSTNMERTSVELRKVVSPENRKLIDDVLGTLDGATRKFDGVLVTMDKVLTDLHSLTMDPKGDVNAIMSETRYVVESVSRHIDSINQNMEGAARNMKEFSRQIRANPGLLLGGTPQQDQAKKQ